MFSIIDPSSLPAQISPTTTHVANFFYRFATQEDLGMIEMIQSPVSSPGVNKTERDTIAQIDSVQDIFECLERKLNDFESMAKTAHECQTFADRELSQQTELLHQALESVDTALKEKNKSLAKLNSLDQCLDTLGDDELKSLTDKLFQDLETWVEENYGALHTNIEISEDRDIRSSPDSGIDDLPGPIGILADVSRCIFNVILCRFMVGTGNPSTLDQAFRMLDTTVQEICPTSVLKHWRSATSTASLSFGKSELKGILDHMVCEIESRYIPTGPSTAFGTKRRIQGLKSLLWRFIHLKGRMERQESLYYFLWIIPSMPFRDENMIRFPRPGDSTGIVERSLSPVLYKLASGHSQPTVVRRGLVKVRENIT